MGILFLKVILKSFNFLHLRFRIKIMDSNKQLGKFAIAFLLFVALMLPTAVQFIHSFEGHEHIVCNDRTTHIHTSKTKCEVCSFQLASFNYDIVAYPEFSQKLIPVKVNDKLTSLVLHSFTITNKQLRAPPVFS